MLLIETKWYSFFKLSAFTSVFWSPVEDLFYSARHRLRIQHIFTVGMTMNILVLLQVLNDTNKSLNSLLQLMCSDLHLHSCRQSLPMRTTSEFDRARCAWALWIVLVKCSPKVKSFIKLVAKISAVSHNSQLSIEMNGSHPHFSWHGCSSAAEVSVVLPEWKPKTSAKTTPLGPVPRKGCHHCWWPQSSAPSEMRTEQRSPCWCPKQEFLGESGIWSCLDQNMATAASYWQILPACLWKNIQRFAQLF